jgi:hypothetical protein
MVGSEDGHTTRRDGPPGQQAASRPGGDNGGVDDAVQDYIDAITDEYRLLFDRLHRLILEENPGVAVLPSSDDHVQ